MSPRKPPSRVGKIDGLFDGWFIPIVFGVVSVLVAVQLISLVPRFRDAFDQMEGRFVAMPSNTVPSVIHQDSAVVILSTNQDVGNPNISVYRNGQNLGVFLTNQMRVSVHEGDEIRVQDKNAHGQSVLISIDTDNSKLLLPAPGQQIRLGGGTKRASLNAAEFI